ncbi:MAG TPA: hypothetical protein VGA20_12060, partial [Gemmatimonadales bacterium]
MAVLPWRGTKQLGYVEYLVHGDGYSTTVLIVLAIIGRRLEDLGLEAERYDVDITIRDGSGAVLERATRHYPGTAPFATLSSSDFLGPERSVTGSIEFLIRCTDAQGRTLDETVIQNDISPDAFLLWTDGRRTCTCTHANMATGDIAPVRAALRGLEWRARELLGRNHTYAGAIAVFEDEEYTSALVLQSYGRPWRTIPLELRNAAGEALANRAPALGPHEVRELPVSEVFPQARAFLAGGPGNILVKSYPEDLRRYRFLVKTTNRASGAFSLDHSFFMSRVARRTYPDTDHVRLGKGFMFPHSVLINDRVRTSVILFNNELEDTAKTVGLLLYDREGRQVRHDGRAAVLPPRGFVHLDFGEYLGLGPDDAFDGHFEIYYAEPCTPDGRYATGLHGQVLYDSPHARESTQVDAAVPWHSPRGFERPPWVLKYETVFMVIPYFCTETLDTSIHCANVSHAWEFSDSATFSCELVDRDGRVIDRHELAIAPNAHVHLSLSELFRRQPADGVGLVFVRGLDRDFSWVPLHYFIECR